MIVCAFCDAGIDEGQECTVYRRGEPVSVHAHCKVRIDDMLKRRRAREEYVRGYSAEALSQLPPWPFARATNPEIDKYIKSKRLRSVVERYDFSRGNLVLIGPAGLGKTVCTVALLHRLHDAAVDRALSGSPSHSYRGDGADHDCIRAMVYATAHDIVKARRESPLGDGEAKLVESCMNSRLLVIDELGFESLHDQVLFEILDFRNKQGGITWVTSGSSSEALKARYGSGFWRRLTERGVIVEEPV